MEAKQTSSVWTALRDEDLIYAEQPFFIVTLAKRGADTVLQMVVEPPPAPSAKLGKLEVVATWVYED